MATHNVRESGVTSTTLRTSFTEENEKNEKDIGIETVATGGDPYGSTGHYEEGIGDLQVLRVSESDNVKLDKDGITVLIPQPSDDPNDPLNWSWTKKHLVLLSIIWASLLTDFSITYGSPLFAAQSITFNMSIPATSRSVTGCLLLQAVGGLLAVPLIQRYGRLPVLFWSQALTSLLLALASISPGFGSFTAFRTLQGLVNTAPQVLGLSMVHDMFFFHERTRKINIWCILLIAGPYVGAFTASWLISVVSWRADWGFCAGLYVLSTLVVIAIGDETLYDRHNPQPRQKGFFGHFKLLVGWTGVKESKQRPSLWTVTKDLFIIALRPQILLLTGTYILVFFTWTISINFTIPQYVTPPPYSFSPAAEAWMWVAPFIGACLGQVWGRWFNDFIQRRYIRKNNGKWVLEHRLWGNYAPALLMFTALVLYGQTLQHSLHWAVLLFAWAMLAFAICSTTTACSAYIVDSFPHHASLVGAIINFWRTAGGFCAPFFTVQWITASGAGTAFGCMAALFGTAFLVGVCITQYFGQRWRLRFPPPPAEN